MEYDWKCRNSGPDRLVADDEKKIHPCNGESAHKGFEIAMGMLRSVVARGQVALPLGPGEPELEALARVLPDAPVLLSFEENRKQYLP